MFLFNRPLSHGHSPSNLKDRKRAGLAGDMGGAKVLLLMLVIGWDKTMCVNWNPIPRKTVRHSGEWAKTKAYTGGGGVLHVNLRPLSLCSIDRFYFILSHSVIILSSLCSFLLLFFLPIFLFCFFSFFSFFVSSLCCPSLPYPGRSQIRTSQPELFWLQTHISCALCTVVCCSLSE